MEQNIALYQKQAQQLNLSQGLRQSLTILQLDVIDLTKYLEERSMENPLLEIKSNLDSLMSGSAESGAFQIADKHESLFHYVLE
ncbi:RNA polymerase sigma-54 factor, partial [Lactiplantibacillus plantarum]